MSRCFRGAILGFCALFATAFAECPFCREQVIETQAVYETEHLLVLLDHQPRVTGHLLVVTKRHIVKAHEMTTEEWEELFAVISKAVHVFLKVLGTDNYVVLEKNGRAAFQQVRHVHFHLLPIQTQKWNDVFPPNIYPERLSSEEMRDTQNMYRAYFESA